MLQRRRHRLFGCGHRWPSRTQCSPALNDTGTKLAAILEIELKPLPLPHAGSPEQMRQAIFERLRTLEAEAEAKRVKEGRKVLGMRWARPPRTPSGKGDHSGKGDRGDRLSSPSSALVHYANVTAMRGRPKLVVVASALILGTGAIGCKRKDPTPWIDAMEADCEASYVEPEYDLVELTPLDDAERNPLSRQRARRVELYLDAEGVRVGSSLRDLWPYSSIKWIAVDLHLAAEDVVTASGGEPETIEYYLYVDEAVAVGEVGVVLAVVHAIANPVGVYLVGQRDGEREANFPKPELVDEIIGLDRMERAPEVFGRLEHEVNKCESLRRAFKASAEAAETEKCRTLVEGFRAATKPCRLSIDWDEFLTLNLFAVRRSRGDRPIVPRQITIDWLDPSPVAARASWGEVGPLWLPDEPGARVKRLPVSAGTLSAGEIAAEIAGLDRPRTGPTDRREAAVACAIGGFEYCATPDLSLADLGAHQLAEYGCLGGSPRACVEWVFALPIETTLEHEREVYDRVIGELESGCAFQADGTCEALSEIAFTLPIVWSEEPEMHEALVARLEPGFESRCDQKDVDACRWLHHIYTFQSFRKDQGKAKAMKKVVCELDPEKCPP